jgi:hypothetical protein
VDELARRTAADRAAVFRAAAAERGLPPPYAEKDFWVCWSLRRLFAPALVDGMVFKGGTSLSKVWEAIHRFSEDIDLTLPRNELPGADRIEIRDTQSVSERKKHKEQLDRVLEAWSGGGGLAAVRARIEAALGTRTGWTLRSAADSMEFEYPKGLPSDEYGGGYVRPIVQLEFGATMPTEPAEDHVIRPYATRAGQYRMGAPDVSVRVLAPERTFWEKATLVHAENNRPEPKSGARVSRHYADVASLAAHAIGARALARIDLLPQVAQEKERYFYAAWARYVDAAHGRLRLVPPPKHEEALRRDYEQMREMYQGNPLPFATILERLGELELAVARHPYFARSAATSG